MLPPGGEPREEWVMQPPLPPLAVVHLVTPPLRYQTLKAEGRRGLRR